MLVWVFACECMCIACACVYVHSGEFYDVSAQGEKTHEHVEVPIYSPVHCHLSCLAQ